MKYLFAIIWFAAAEIAMASSFRLSQYEKATLTNGLRVFQLENHEVPLIEMQIVIDVGSTQDGVLRGLAYLTSQSLALGTSKYTQQQLEDRLDFLGAHWTAETEKERTRFKTSFDKKDLAEMLGIAANLLEAPKFPQKKFDELKQKSLAEMEQLYESPSRVVGRYFDSYIFQGTPFANPADGTKEGLAKIERSDVEKFFHKYYGPRRARIILTGDIVPAEAMKLIAAGFASWQSQSEAPSDIPASPAKHPGVLLIDKPDATQATFMIGATSVPNGFADDIEAQVVNTILGGRFTSWLNSELRVKSGLTYGARSRLEGFKTVGSFYISSYTKTETAIEAIDLALATYRRLFHEGISDEELSSGISYLKGQFPPHFETSAQLAALIDDLEFYGKDLNRLNEFDNRLKSLTKEKTRQLIQQVFPEKDLTFVVIGNAAILREKLKKYGPIKELSIKHHSLAS